EAAAHLARGDRNTAEAVSQDADTRSTPIGFAWVRGQPGAPARRGGPDLGEPLLAPAPAHRAGLTAPGREGPVLLRPGRTNRQIGEELFISTKTASVHVSNILSKLRVANRGEAAAQARRLGLDAA